MPIKCMSAQLVSFKKKQNSNRIMAGRIIDIAGEPRSLSLYRGFLIVKESENRRELGRIDLDGVLTLLISSKGATITTSLIAECADRLIPIIFCNRYYQATSITQPVNPHFDQNRRHEIQFSSKKGLKNKIWQRIIKAKIKAQADFLMRLEATATQRLHRLMNEVKAGDSGNCEAQAAQIYWPCVFGSSFRRGNSNDPVNAMLNYGYAVIRGAMLKAVLSTGLHTSCGVHHSNRNNPYCLVDDLMEPYRPLTDQLVRRLFEKGHKEVTVDVKKSLASIVTADVHNAGQLSPMFQDMVEVSRSIWRCFETEQVNLSFSSLLSELEVEGMASLC